MIKVIYYSIKNHNYKMLVNFNTINIKENVLKGSIVILGAGISGIFLAYLLKDTGKKIIVIEKNDYPDLDIENLEHKKNSEGEVFNKSFNAINKFFGGWSNYWGGLLVELKESDINKKYWGFSYNDLVKLYDEVYRIFNIRLDRDSIEKANNINELENYCLKKKLSFYLKEPNFIYYFEEFIKNNKNVYFYYNCTIKDVIVQNNKVRSIEISNVNNKVSSVIGDEFVLSMGTYGNNQFLLSLKEKEPNFLKSERIGKHIHDHIGVEVGNVEIYDKKGFRNHFENAFYNGSKYQAKILNKNGNLSISGQFNDKNNLDPHVAEIKKFIKNFFFRIKINYDKRKISLKGLFLFSKFIWHWIFTKKILNFTSKNILFYVQSEQSVIDINIIKINKKQNNDKNFLKEISFKWKFKDEDFEEITKFTHNVDIFLRKNRLGKIDCFDLSPDFFKNNMESTYHLSGGTIIAKDINSGVCDKSFKVWGVDNLYISGASLFPCSGSANITMTILATALKLSKKLKTL